MVQKSCTSWYGKYPIIYKVLCIPGGSGCLGFLNHQQYHHLAKVEMSTCILPETKITLARKPSRKETLSYKYIMCVYKHHNIYSIASSNPHISNVLSLYKTSRLLTKQPNKQPNKQANKQTNKETHKQTPFYSLSQPKQLIISATWSFTSSIFVFGASSGSASAKKTCFMGEVPRATGVYPVYGCWTKNRGGKTGWCL